MSVVEQRICCVWTYSRELIMTAVWLNQGMLDMCLGQKAVKDGAGVVFGHRITGSCCLC